MISDKSLESLENVELQSSSKRLCGPDEISTNLAYRDTSCDQPVYVVKKLQQNLLGLPAIWSVNILAQVDAIVKSVPDQYPDVFTGLGTFPETCQVKLKPDAEPLVLFAPRNVPIPLRPKVQEELSRMEYLGVISRVEQPMWWCSGMVVPKKTGSVRICVDFRRLNESVLRETHPLPKVDNSLAHLAGATVFSTIDANSGFWQIPIDESS